MDTFGGPDGRPSTGFWLLAAAGDAPPSPEQGAQRRVEAVDDKSQEHRRIMNERAALMNNAGYRAPVLRYSATPPPALTR